MELHATIVGTGKIGTAIAAALERQGVAVATWNITAQEQDNPALLRKIIPGVTAVFLCVPSWAVRPAFVAVRPYVEPSTVVVSLAKGIEISTGKTMDEVLAEVAGPDRSVALLSGPMMAYKLRDGAACAGVVATSSRKSYDAVATMFRGSNLSLEYSDDVRGVALAGVLKNIYALAVGQAIGLKKDDHAVAQLVKDAEEEMVKIGVVLGAQQSTIRGTAGFADFVETAFDSESRNRTVGEQLDDVRSTHLESEGLFSVQTLVKHHGADMKMFPIFHSVYDAAVEKSVPLYKGEPAK